MVASVEIENLSIHDEERAVWEFMTPKSWHDSVAHKDSIFYKTYAATRHQLEQTILNGGYDVIIEVGCGTGDVIANMDTKIQRYGLDINAEFVNFCKDTYEVDNCEFLVVDAIFLEEWWKKEGLDKKFSKPLVSCVNNTLNIMPDGLRGRVIDQMLHIAGPDGVCMATYWNGNFFSHAILEYYKKNPQLCGEFDIDKHVNWDKRTLVSPSEYSTEWHTPIEVEQLMHANDVDVTISTSPPTYDGKPEINMQELAIFIWYDQTSSSNAKGYYDSDDAQKFYSHVWGGNAIHVGRHDLLTKEDISTMSNVHQVSLAGDKHEKELMETVRSLMSTDCAIVGSVGLRVVDMGCGYSSLLRHMWREKLLWSGVGVDLSSEMCSRSKVMNAKFDSECNKNVRIIEGSFLDIDVRDESADLVVSIDSLLHVGPVRQHRAVQEAARILRPGGWMIFSDIMQSEDADADEMQPIYDRINLSKMGTVSNYKTALEKYGFTNFQVDLHSDNIATHYGKVREVMEEQGSSCGISDSYLSKMAQGLSMWEELGPKNIVWGIIAARKTQKVTLKN
mmetsp:Transcript_49081/g.59211  ORF Transcript_49081/g.59211 Transcript_49081/m.59211 type:complete len:561 (+) Transcript_49081:39-1721(+)|eukprot:CAMPEP_0194375570 /NCGR_PEP_ID=MMETSP0174-20130528/24105_1 /TAXON_ID=216777 /ORGANISM="Proboscia alata, Strain PI-D3" /LENGTH=560 /DNA_ID=CAMNT_0039155855 /DNA_START=64 /DNA_END=1746 /DNA_ORIENTATION=+